MWRSSTCAAVARPARNEWPENFWRRSPSERSPRTPAARAVRLTSRATCLSVSRSDPASLPPLPIRRNSGPWAMRPSFSQGLQGAPPGLATHADEDALVQEFDPAGAVLGVVGPAVEPGDFAAAQAAGEADQQDGAVAQAAQIVGEGSDHAQEIVGENGFLLVGPPGVPAPDAAHHLGDVAIGAVERLAALGAVPGDGREPTLDGAHRVRLLAGGRGLRRRSSKIQPDHLWVRGQGLEVPAPAPSGVMAPIGGVGAQRSCGLGCGFRGLPWPRRRNPSQSPPAFRGVPGPPRRVPERADGVRRSLGGWPVAASHFGALAPRKGGLGELQRGKHAFLNPAGGADPAPFCDERPLAEPRRREL
jgi:hypothetical protein